MAVINTGLLTKGVKSSFFELFNQLHGEQTVFQDLCTTIPSDSDQENYRWLGSVPVMREWGTGRKAKGLHSEEYNVKNLKYESTIEVDRDEIADDQTGQIAIRVKEQAQRAAWHKDYLIAQLLLNGSGTGYNSYDGVPFFDAAHVSGLSGTQANEANFDVTTVVSASPVPFEPDSTTLYGPQTALAAFNTAVAAMLTFKDDQGEYMHRSHIGGWVVVCSPARLYTWIKAFGATVLGESGTNVPVVGGPPRIISMPDLTSAAVFYVLKTDGVVRPFIFQDREPIEFTSLERDSDEGFRREKYLYGVRARYRVTYGQWQHAYAMTMT